MNKYHRRYPSQIKVFASCVKRWIFERDTQFVNIEEDMAGRDLLTYSCPLCHQQHQSLRTL